MAYQQINKLRAGALLIRIFSKIRMCHWFSSFGVCARGTYAGCKCDVACVTVYAYVHPSCNKKQSRTGVSPQVT